MDNFELEVQLPYPPVTGNHVWKHAGGRHYLTRQATVYYTAVASSLRHQGKVLDLEVGVHVHCQLAPPDRRRRDLDNVWKVLADALTRGGLWRDDKLIRRLTLEWTDPQPGGAVTLRLAPADERIATC